MNMHLSLGFLLSQCLVNYFILTLMFKSHHDTKFKSCTSFLLCEYVHLHWFEYFIYYYWFQISSLGHSINTSKLHYSVLYLMIRVAITHQAHNIFVYD